MSYIGIDHSTTAVRTNILFDDGSCESFSIEREPEQDLDFSYTDRLFRYITPEEINQIAYGYSYGDGISKIKNIEDVDNRGVVDTYGLGHEIGLGTIIYDQLLESPLPCVIFPGINNNIDNLHPYFKHYRLITGADKFATARFAKYIVKKMDSKNQIKSIISANISSSSMAVYQSGDGIRGAFFWLGLVHGWGDVKTFREARKNPENLRRAYLNSGILNRKDMNFNQVYHDLDESITDLLYWSCIHNVHSLVPFAKKYNQGPDLIVLSGRLIRSDNMSDLVSRCRRTLSELGKIHISEENATAVGASLIARDVAKGESDIMGVPVDK